MTVDPGILAGAVVIVVGALTTATLAIMKQLTASRLEILAATTALHTKVEIVEHATNSLATRSAEVIRSQEQQIVMYRDQVADLRQTALLLAQSQAVRPTDTAHTLAENTAMTREIRDAVVTKVEP